MITYSDLIKRATSKARFWNYYSTSIFAINGHNWPYVNCWQNKTITASKSKHQSCGDIKKLSPKTLKDRQKDYLRLILELIYRVSYFSCHRLPHCHLILQTILLWRQNLHFLDNVWSAHAQIYQKHTSLRIHT